MGHRTIWLCVWMALLGACSEPPPAPKPAPPPMESVALQLWGYRAIHRDEIWLFDAQKRPSVRVEGPLQVKAWQVLWAPAQGAERPLKVKLLERMGGWLFQVEAEGLPELSSGVLRLVDAHEREVGRWRARWDVPPGERPTQAEAVKLRKKGELKPAEALLRARVTELKGEDLMWAQVELGRVLGRLGRQGEACEMWLEAAKTAESLGWVSEAGARHRACAYYALMDMRLDDVTGMLKAGERYVLEVDYGGRARGLYYEALKLITESEFHRALLKYREAYTVSRGGGSPMETSALGLELLDVNYRLGRLDGVSQLLPELLSIVEGCEGLPASYCLQGKAGILGIALNANAASEQNQKVEQSKLALVDLLEHAKALSEEDVEVSAALNLAWFEYQYGELERAEAYLNRLKGRMKPESQRLWRLIRAELAFSRGQVSEAMSGYQALLDAELSQTRSEASDLVWRATLGLARVYRAQKAHVEARTMYLKASGLLVASAANASARHGFSSYIGDNGDVFSEAMGFCQSQMDTDCVETVIMLAVSNFYTVLYQVAQRSVSESQGARLLKKRLEALESEIALAYDEREIRVLNSQAEAIKHSLKKEVESAFFKPSDTHSTRYAIRPEAGSHTFELIVYPSGDACTVLHRAAEAVAFKDHYLSECNSKTLKAWLTKRTLGEGTQVLLTSPLREFDLAELELNGQPLSARHLVTSMVPVPGVSSALSEGPFTLLADPESNLPGARVEAQALNDLLGNNALQINLKVGSEATRANLIESIQHSRLVHFAGHGVIRHGDPWTSHLRLSERQTLSVEDVLQTQVKAETLVLNGCDTGKGGNVKGGARIGLPEAFLIAGARFVVGTERPIEDGESLEFMKDFYRLYPTQGTPRAFHEAQKRAQQRGDEVWRAFRLWSR
ncbi:MAG: CHAT domain-containing protein [Bradymonadia bacterium]